MTEYYFLTDGSTKFPKSVGPSHPDYTHVRNGKLSFLLTLNLQNVASCKLWNVTALRELSKDLLVTTVDKKRMSKCEMLEALSLLQESERLTRVSNYALLSEKYDGFGMEEMDVTPENVLQLLSSPNNSPEDVALLAEACLRSKYTNVTTLVKCVVPGFKRLVRNHLLMPTIPTVKLETFLSTLSSLIRMETVKVDKQYKDKVWERQSVGRTEIFPATMHQFHLDTLRNLELVTVDEITIAIAYATGRRMAEIRGIGSEFTVNSSNSVMFKGQLKTKVDVPAYIIPTLLPASLVVSAFNKLRELNELHPPTVVNSRLAKRFSTALPPNLRAIWTKAGISKFKDNRNTYATVLLNQLAPSQTPSVFLNKILGHSEQDIQTGLTYQAFWTRDLYSPETLEPVGFIDTPDKERFQPKPATVKPVTIPEYSWADFDREHNQ